MVTSVIITFGGEGPACAAGGELVGDDAYGTALESRGSTAAVVEGDGVGCGASGRERAAATGRPLSMMLACRSVHFSRAGGCVARGPGGRRGRWRRVRRVMCYELGCSANINQQHCSCGCRIRRPSGCSYRSVI